MFFQEEGGVGFLEGCRYYCESVDCWWLMLGERRKDVVEGDGAYGLGKIGIRKGEF